MLLDSGSLISFIKCKYINSDFLKHIDEENHKYHGIRGPHLKIIGECIMQNLAREIELFVVQNYTMKPVLILERDYFVKFGFGITQRYQIDILCKKKYLTSLDFLSEVLNKEERCYEKIRTNACDRIAKQQKQMSKK